jgi:transcriptional regulator GlxA family with amidase domain
LHRLAAAEQAGCAELLCEVHFGTLAEARRALGVSDGASRLASGSRDASTVDTSDEIVMRAISYMRANLESSLSVAELARRIGVSAPHLRRRFRKAKQLNPRAIFTELRKERARELLGTTDLAVKEIADRLGYKTVSAFGRAFLRVWGEAPGESRRRHRVVGGIDSKVAPDA